MSPDTILELLIDSKWHDITEVADILNQPEKQLTEALDFYVKFNFIQLDKEQKKVQIDPRILEFFKHTQE